MIGSLYPRLWYCPGSVGFETTFMVSKLDLLGSNLGRLLAEALALLEESVHPTG